jgi:hypothetical protein
MTNDSVIGIIKPMIMDKSYQKGCEAFVVV